MKLVAIYKTWDGGEFVDASLASVYSHVDSIVMVHSDISWLGEYGNSVKELAVRWCQQFDTAGKVHHLDVSLSNQEAQYAAGIDYIQRHDLGQIYMVVDADEVWEDAYIENAKRQIFDRPCAAYRCNMHTYLKTPFYQIDPPFGSPTAFLRHPKYLTTSPRGSQAPARQLNDCWMHHYTYVRELRSDVERKLRQSAQADRNEQVIPNWMESVYDRLPEGEGLHAFERWRCIWQKIKKIWYSDLPPAMRTAELLRQWWPDHRQIFDNAVSDWVSLLPGEENAIHRLAVGREQAVDLGTYRGASAVALALACRRVHTVDFYDRRLGDSSSEYFTMGGHSLQKTQELCDRFGNMTCESADTVEAARTWLGGAVDVLFVDAEHSERATRANIDAWLPHLRTGARIIFHDDIESQPAVQSAIRRLRDDPRFRFFEPGEFAGSVAVCEVVR